MKPTSPRGIKGKHRRNKGKALKPTSPGGICAEKPRSDKGKTLKPTTKRQHKGGGISHLPPKEQKTKTTKNNQTNQQTSKQTQSRWVPRLDCMHANYKDRCLCESPSFQIKVMLCFTMLWNRCWRLTLLWAIKTCVTRSVARPNMVSYA